MDVRRLQLKLARAICETLCSSHANQPESVNTMLSTIPNAVLQGPVQRVVLPSQDKETGRHLEAKRLLQLQIVL